MRQKKQYIIYLTYLICFLSIHAIEKDKYPHSFNPMQGMVKDVEKPFRSEICLNGSWDFMPIYNAKASDFSYPQSFIKDEVNIKIPSPWNVNGFTDKQGGDFRAYPSYPEKWEAAQIGWMRKSVFIPKEWDTKQVILHFEGVLGKTMVYVNGEKVAENFDLFLPFDANITSYLKPSQNNEIVVGVAKGSLFDDEGQYGRRTYVGGSMWGIEMAGIWQDVYLFAYNSVFVKDLFVQPDVYNKKVRVEVEISNTSSQKKIVELNGDVRKWYNLAGRTINESPVEKGELSQSPSLIFNKISKVELPPNSTTKVVLEKDIQNELEYWTPDSPNLYGLVLSMREKNQLIDKKYERFGWRQFSLSGNRLLLNGEEIQLRGDSWHFMGVPQMTRRYPWAWYSMLKDANANAVRLHAQPFPRFYLDVADEMGICVLDETGIWSSDGGPKIDNDEYWLSCENHLRRLIRRDKNHPSIFGWSVCNETVPVALHVFKAPESLIEKQVQEINRWVKITKEEDPTRPWISGDGETDRPTDLPIIIGHYGGIEGMKKWSEEGKPWGIGEQSMAYYGTPKQASAYNGNRAYESMEGRMEAVAIEGYDLIKTQRQLNASYSCIFNLAWYGLQPLNLGLKDATHKPTLADGVFFDFEEGAYGMQPERLGPYVTTLNPGYDKSLPLYRTWPLWDAVRSANATPIQPYSGKISEEQEPLIFVSPVDEIVLSASRNSKLKDELENLGFKILTDYKATPKTLLVIDGLNPPENTKSELDKIKKAISVGAKILIWGVSPHSKNLLNELLQYPVELEDRTATSFLKARKSPVLQGLEHSDFYFSELIPKEKNAMQYALSGDFAAKANVLLRACNTDWQRWNYQPETSKTGNVIRSENESKSSDIVMASFKQGASDIILSTLDLRETAMEGQILFTSILKNLGGKVSAQNLQSMNALGSDATLHKALVLNLSRLELESEENLLITEYLEGESQLTPQFNMITNNQTWRVLSSDENGMFSFAKPENDKASLSYISFWIYSPRSLSNLLAEPDMPSLDMSINTDASFVLFLNKKKIATHLHSSVQDVSLPNIMLDKGWNHVMIKIMNSRNNEDLKISVKFSSTDNIFMKQIQSTVNK